MRFRFLWAVPFLLAAWPAFAQVSPNLVTPTATLAAQPTVLCSTAPAVNTQATCTVSVQGQQYAYITAIYFDVCTNGTGTAQNNVTFTSTGLQTSPSWPYSVAATASICQHWGDTGGGDAVLAKGNLGTNVVITSPAAATNNSYGIRVYGYLAP